MNRYRKLQKYAKQNSNNPTNAEKIFWDAIKCRKILRQQTNRQVVMNGYIVDFYFVKTRIIVELDGEYHNSIQQKKKYNSRTKILELENRKVLRFTNKEVIENLDSVLTKIKAEITLRSNKTSKRASVCTDIN